MRYEAWATSLNAQNKVFMSYLRHNGLAKSLKNNILVPLQTQ